MPPTDRERQLRDNSQVCQAPHHPHQQTPAAASSSSIDGSSKVVAKPRFDKGFSFTDSNTASDDEIPPVPAYADRGLDAVTPGIELATYHHWPDDAPTDSPSYFSNADPKIRTSPHHESHRRIPPLGQTSATMNRRESLSEIRAANPDLSLSGNIISATFTPTHAFTYRKGGQWVSNFPRRAINPPWSCGKQEEEQEPRLS